LTVGKNNKGAAAASNVQPSEAVICEERANKNSW